MERFTFSADTEILHLFGPANSRTPGSIGQRIRQLFNLVARSLSLKRRSLAEIQPILEYVSSRHQIGWILLADLLQEFGGENKNQIAKEFLLKYLEKPDSDEFPAFVIWKRVAEMESDAEHLQGHAR